MSTISNWQAGFLELLPAVQTHAQIQFRKLPLERREDAIQETIAAACVGYQLAAAQGRLNVVRPGMLADFAVRHVRTGRHVGGRQDAAQDVISLVAQRRHSFTTSTYDWHDEHGGEWTAMVVADRQHPIPETAAFDFAGWLRTLSRRDREGEAAFLRRAELLGEFSFPLTARSGHEDQVLDRGVKLRESGDEKFNWCLVTPIAVNSGQSRVYRSGSSCSIDHGLNLWCLLWRAGPNARGDAVSKQLQMPDGEHGAGACAAPCRSSLQGRGSAQPHLRPPAAVLGMPPDFNSEAQLQSLFRFCIFCSNRV